MLPSIHEIINIHYLYLSALNTKEGTIPTNVVPSCRNRVGVLKRLHHAPRQPAITHYSKSELRFPIASKMPGKGVSL